MHTAALDEWIPEFQFQFLVNFFRRKKILRPM